MTSLLQKEFVRYHHVPVSGEEDLKKLEIGPTIQSLVLINCGGTLDVLKEIPALADESTTVYIIDSHLPHHPANIDDPQQVKF